MRGLPLLEILMITVLFGLAAVPLARLTTPPTIRTAPAPAGEEPPAQTTYAELRFAHPPSTVAIGNTPIEAPDFDAEIDLDATTLLKVTWPDGTPTTAVTLSLEPEGLPAIEHTYWSTRGAPLEVLVPRP